MKGTYIIWQIVRIIKNTIKCKKLFVRKTLFLKLVSFISKPMNQIVKC